jgi:toxin-antitoxin system PIN domain toxin
MIAVDSNVLVYAHRRDSESYPAARDLIAGLVTSASGWAIPYPCIHEYIRNVTDPRIYTDPTSLDRAFDQIAAWTETQTLRLIGERSHHLELLVEVSRSGRVRGAAIHDARIAAICLEHGVGELWTADRDFSRFPALKTRNPLVG